MDEKQKSEELQRAEKIAENVIQFMRNLNWKPTLFSNDEIPERAEMLAVNSILQELKPQPPVPKSVRELAEKLSVHHVDYVAALITSFLDSRVELVWDGLQAKWGIFKIFLIGEEANGYAVQILFGGSNVYFYDERQEIESAKLTAQKRLNEIISGKQSFGITKE